MALILVMDDDPGIRDLLEETLTAAGHTMLAASNGRDGLQVCKAHPPDLMIIDLFMPEKEGLETIQEIRAMQAGAKIIAISGAPAELKVLDMAKKLGAQEVLRKPFLPDEILAAVNRLLGTV